MHARILDSNEGSYKQLELLKTVAGRNVWLRWHDRTKEHNFCELFNVFTTAVVAAFDRIAGVNDVKWKCKINKQLIPEGVTSPES